MSLKYHLVQKRDMRKGAAEDAMLYYGQVRVQEKISFKKLCDKVSAYSTASKGDVQLVISGLLFVLTDYLEMGHVVQVGELGNFRMTAGCSGIENKEDFNTSLFKKGRVLFTPGSMLRDLQTKTTFDKLMAIEKPCDLVHID